MTDSFVRDATEADLPQLVLLLDQLADGRRRDATVTVEERAAFAAVQADVRQRLLVIEEDKRVVGTAVFILVPNLSRNGRPYATLENIVVDLADRGRRHGERLLRFMIDEARAAGCYKVVLTSARRRTGAHRFYERMGFAAASEGFRMDLQRVSRDER